MDNVYSSVTIKPPVVPADFEGMAGTTKADLAAAILKLVAESIVAGINQEQPSSFDLNAINNRLNEIENELDIADIKSRTIRMDAVTNATLTVPFEDMGTDNYTVDAAFIVPDATDINTVTWALIIDSKKSNQCKLRIDGTAAAYEIEVRILENK